MSLSYRFLITVFIILFSLGSICPVAASAGVFLPPVKWTEVPLPASGDAGDWVLAPGSDLSLLAASSDGTLYVAAESSGDDSVLYRSTDNGTSWSRIVQCSEVINCVAVASDDTGLVFYATPSAVFRSVDGGATFHSLPPLPFGTDAEYVASITVAGHNGTYTVVAVARSHGAAPTNAHIYLLDENPIFSLWQKIEMGDCDVLAVAALPFLNGGQRLLAVTANEAGTCLQIVNIGSSGYEIIPHSVTIPGLKPSYVRLAFPPSNQTGTGEVIAYLGLATGSGSGDIFRIHWPLGMAGTAESLNMAAVLGTGNSDITAILAGGIPEAPYLLTAAGGKIYLSIDAGVTWKPVLKQPTGTSVTGFAVSPGSSREQYLFTATSGTQSALSRSSDGGWTWNQVGLIDTIVPAGGIVDMAVSLQYEDCPALFMLTRDSGYSLWQTGDDGVSWERVFSTALIGDGSFSRVAVSPQYGQKNRAVYLAGMIGDTPAVWRSFDGGNSFLTLGAPYVIDAWAVPGDECLVIAGYDGTNSLVCLSGNGGYFYSLPVKVGEHTLKSIVSSPAYYYDRTLLIGSTAGLVYLSSDNGTSFKQIGQALPGTTAFPGQVSVAFAPDFNDSKTIYGASDCPSTDKDTNRLFSYNIARDKKWQTIDSSLPVKSIINQIMISPARVLYAANSVSTINSGQDTKGGIRRTLECGSSGTFETVALGLENGATLHGLWLAGSHLWSIDTTNTRLMTFHDTLSGPVALESPVDDAPGINPNNVVLNWKSPAGAVSYQWQVDTDRGFSSIPENFEGNGSASSAGLPPLSLAATYYWRVRVTAPVSGPWSDTFSFHTRLGNAVIAPQLLSPAAGAVDQPACPAFQWGGIDQAEQYELVVSTDISFAAPVFAREGPEAVSGTAYQADAALESGKTYYWKVRAVGAGSYSDWSPAGVFTVALPPASPTPEIKSAPSREKQPDTTVPNNIIINNSVTSPGFPPGLVILLTGTGIVLTVLLIAILIVLIRRKP